VVKVRSRPESFPRAPELYAWRWRVPARCLRIPASALCRHGRNARKDGCRCSEEMPGAKVSDVEFDAVRSRPRSENDFFFLTPRNFNAFSHQVRKNLVDGLTIAFTWPAGTAFSIRSSTFVRTRATSRKLSSACASSAQQFVRCCHLAAQCRSHVRTIRRGQREQVFVRRDIRAARTAAGRAGELP